MTKQKIVTLKVQVLDKLATIPTKTHNTDAGWDLYTTKKSIIPTNALRALETGISIAIPDGYYGQISERSGFSMQNTLKLKAGVIDSGYRGEIKIVFQNCGDTPITIVPNTKIAQLLILPLPNTELVVVEKLDETERGTNGFGSSDKPIND